MVNENVCLCKSSVFQSSSSTASTSNPVRLCQSVIFTVLIMLAAHLYTVDL